MEKDTPPTIAVHSGELAKPTKAVLNQLGIQWGPDRVYNWKATWNQAALGLTENRPSEVPAVVECPLAEKVVGGITNTDAWIENQSSALLFPIPTTQGNADIVLALEAEFASKRVDALNSQDPYSFWKELIGKAVATEFPTIVAHELDHFNIPYQVKGVSHLRQLLPDSVTIISVSGKTEGYPAKLGTDLCPAVVDVCSTGNTLKCNGLGKLELMGGEIGIDPLVLMQATLALGLNQEKLKALETAQKQAVSLLATSLIQLEEIYPPNQQNSASQ
jgi:ATP phosphoribosyltransferase